MQGMVLLCQCTDVGRQSEILAMTRRLGMNRHCIRLNKRHCLIDLITHSPLPPSHVHQPILFPLLKPFRRPVLHIRQRLSISVRKSGIVGDVIGRGWFGGSWLLPNPTSQHPQNNYAQLPPSVHRAIRPASARREWSSWPHSFQCVITSTAQSQSVPVA